jgi:hypothetical protein
MGAVDAAIFGELNRATRGCFVMSTSTKPSLCTVKTPGRAARSPRSSSKPEKNARAVTVEQITLAWMRVSKCTNRASSLASSSVIGDVAAIVFFLRKPITVLNNSVMVTGLCRRHEFPFTACQRLAQTGLVQEKESELILDCVARATSSLRVR